MKTNGKTIDLHKIDLAYLFRLVKRVSHGARDHGWLG